MNDSKDAKSTAESEEKKLAREALELHASGRPGKLEIHPTKPLTTQKDLSLAYSPGVAAPCKAIHADPVCAYDYTNKSNTVAVISNGTAVLGLGNLGGLASKPVMEGKAVLFKRFADIDGIDLELDCEDAESFINAVKHLGPSFGGINLEDIKAPDCYIIEQALKEKMDIPVFHDDQHGTAIIAAAGLINACHLTEREMEDLRVVVNGAGAAGIACVELFKQMGVQHNNVIICDTRGVIHKDREEGMNQWKSAHAVETDLRTLEEAMVGADVFLGVSVKDAVTPEMVKSMADKPIIFALANPDPEITPAEVKAVRDDAIIATGRSDYPNQVNNVLGFPYIFRGALDVRARQINEEMKIAAARALAEMAREDVPDEVDRAYAGRRLHYGPDYIIPAPFDPRLITRIPMAVAQAAVETGVAGKPIEDWGAYRLELRQRLDFTAGTLQRIFDEVREQPRRVVFAEGEQDRVIRAAMEFSAAGYGTPILVGREAVIMERLKAMGLSACDNLEIANAKLSEHNPSYIYYMYNRLQREGKLYSDCRRMVNQNRNIFSALMVEHGHADAMVTGLTRPFAVCHKDILRVVDPNPGEEVFGLSILALRGYTLFVADTTVNELPTAQQLTDIAVQAAHVAANAGYEPRVAFLSFSNFGQPMRVRAEHVREAVRLMDQRDDVDFEYDGEMAADVAMDYGLMQDLYPFCRLTGPANVLVMPALHAANITTKLIGKIGSGTLIGPLLMGISKPLQVFPMGSTVNDIVNTAAIAAHQSLQRQD